jgi:hypothetical protein
LRDARRRSWRDELHGFGHGFYPFGIHEPSTGIKPENSDALISRKEIVLFVYVTLLGNILSVSTIPWLILWALDSKQQRNRTMASVTWSNAVIVHTGW